MSPRVVEPGGLAAALPLVSRSRDLPNSYLRFALGILMFTYGVNFADRTILSVLLEAIRKDLHLTDTQLGALTGVAFALFYAMAGIPIARWADRSSRPKVIAISLALWSLMTAVSGFATNFLQLFAARLLVGVGEAGGTPASLSLLASYFPPGRLARVCAMYCLGATLGISTGLVLGGWLNEHFGWRLTLMLIGGPGLLLAVANWLFLKETTSVIDRTPNDTQSRPLLHDLMYLAKQPAYLYILAAGAALMFCEYGILQWMPTFLIRSQGLSSLQAGAGLGVVVGISQAVGVLMGGYLADFLARRDDRWSIWLAAAASVAAAPFVWWMLITGSTKAVIILIAIPQCLGSVYYAPVIAMIQRIAPERMRAMASAVSLLVFNLVGLGLGPQIIGIMSDRLHSQFGDQSLRHAMLICVGVFLFAGLALVAAARFIPTALRNSARENQLTIGLSPPPIL